MNVEGTEAQHKGKEAEMRLYLNVLYIEKDEAKLSAPDGMRKLKNGILILNEKSMFGFQNGFYEIRMMLLLQRTTFILLKAGKNAGNVVV